MLRSVIAACCLLLAGATTASAQGVDFTGQMQPSLATNEQLVRQIRGATSSSSDLEAVFQLTELPLGTGQQLEQQLSQALATAPDDAARSRVEGVLTHTQAALESLRLVGQEQTLDAARGRLEQARGEAQEGLDELRPFVLAVALPVELPAAGSVYVPEIAALPFIGVVLVIVGVVLRVAARAR
jgi:hypothetical protein